MKLAIYEKAVFPPFQNSLLHATWTPTTRNFCLSKLECHEGYSRTRRRESADGKSRGHERGRERVAYFTFCWRSRRTQLVLSYSLSFSLWECRQKVWWFRGERQDRVGSQVLYFFTRTQLCGCDSLRRRSVRPVCGPKRTRERGTSFDPREYLNLRFRAFSPNIRIFSTPVFLLLVSLFQRAIS